ncbi:hypothetical protein OS128_08210 [Corynebacterium sp. P5848]|uniref:hypothetical protein n=1 Tax=Corynebacterium marambiense TaxID=2765364 RepID=UPI002260EE82|nr:hypothetical protein [Corynebacterium marambiense]MCX7542897.1 hypothetical protein [Corynebacterium marambiense]
MRESAIVYFTEGPTVPWLSKFRYSRNIYAYPCPAPSREPLALLSSTGSGVVGGEFFQQGRVDTPIFRKCANLPQIAKITSTTRGALSFTFADTFAEEIGMFPDPLGGVFTFIFEDTESVAASNDLSALVRFLKSLGKDIRRNLAYSATLATMGHSGLVPTPYKNISVLPQFKWLHFSNRGAKQEVYSDFDQLVADDLSDSELFEATRADILENLRLASLADTEIKISHLTGGFDSRLILGGLLCNQLQERYAFYTSGDDRSADKTIANSLKKHYHLRTTDQDGLKNVGAATDFQTRSFLSYEVSDGIVSFSSVIGAVPTKSLILSGGYGEFLRSPFKSRDLLVNDIPAAALRIYGDFAFGPCDSRIISDSLMEYCADRLSSMRSSAFEKGVRPDSIADYFYSADRSRWFIGPTTNTVNRFASRFDPLYSVNALRLAINTPSKEKNCNYWGVRMMESFSPGLSQLPFDTPRIDRCVAERLGLGSGIAFRNEDREPNLVHWSSLDSTAKPISLERPIKSKPTLLSRADVEDIATRLQMSESHVRIGYHALNNLEPLFAYFDREQLETTFNLPTLKRRIHRKPNSRIFLRVFTALYSHLLWQIYSQ